MFSSFARQAARRSLLCTRIRLISTKQCLDTFVRTTSSVLQAGAYRHRRWFATPPPQVVTSDLSVERYHALSESTMDLLLDSLENLLDDVANPNYEVEYHSGVLTLNLSEKGIYVINKQPPNKQIWLSSPLSGPKRYDYSEAADDWLYSRDGRAMGDLLNQELSEALGQDINLELTKISGLL